LPISPPGNVPGAEGPSTLTYPPELSGRGSPLPPHTSLRGLQLLRVGATRPGRGSPPRHRRIPGALSPPLRAEAWARRSPSPVGLAGGGQPPVAEERAPPLPTGPLRGGRRSPFLRRRNPAWGRGRERWGRGMSCPQAAGWSGRAEGLTCRLRPPGRG